MRKLWRGCGVAVEWLSSHRSPRCKTGSVGHGGEVRVGHGGHDGVARALGVTSQI